MSDVKMYFRGLGATMMTLAGVFVFVLSFGVYAISDFAGLIMTTIGIVLFFAGRALRFKHKRESGHILYRG